MEVPVDKFVKLLEFAGEHVYDTSKDGMYLTKEDRKVVLSMYKLANIAVPSHVKAALKRGRKLQKAGKTFPVCS